MTPSSPNTMRAVSERNRAQRRHRAHSPSPQPSTSDMQARLATGSVLAAPSQFETLPLQSIKRPDRLPSAGETSNAPSNLQTASISASKSTSSFVKLDTKAANRPRSKSIAAVSNAHRPSLVNRADQRDIPLPSSQPPLPQPTASSKLSLRNRLFGNKSSKGASPTTSSVESGTETPSPASPRFPPSAHSEASHSESSHADPHGGPYTHPEPSSPAYSDPNHGHARDADDDAALASDSDIRSSRKTSSASSFLRKTIRFKDKSAYLKQRPSTSSINPDSPASPSSSVPPSPADPSAYDLDDAARKASLYKQVSGRRGLQYHDPTHGQSRSDATGSQGGSQSDPLNTKSERDAIALLPAVTERQLEASPALASSLLSTSNDPPSNQSRSSSVSQLLVSESRSYSQDATSSPRLATASGDPELRSHVPRSSSLRGSVIHAKPASPHVAGRFNSPSLLRADAFESPHRRPRSGSEHSFSPHIQPRTTSSPSQGSMRRPNTAQDSPTTAQSRFATVPAASRSAQRPARPKTADVDHGYSSSLSSLRDVLMVANAISEEGAVYHTPEKKDVARFESQQESAESKPAGSPSDSKRPGLPPKNPLRKQRPSATSVTNTPSVSGDSPVSIQTTGVFSGPTMVQRDKSLSGSTPRTRETLRRTSVSSSTHSSTEYKTPTSDPASLPPTAEQREDDYFRPHNVTTSQDAQIAQPAPRSAGLPTSPYSGTSSPAQSSFFAGQQLSRVPSSDSTAGWSGRHQRAGSDATNSISDLKSSNDPGASTTSLHSESSSSTRRKKENAGGKMFSFARDSGNRTGGDPNATITSSSTFRLGRSSKSKKGDAVPRPVIRRIYDGSLEGEAAAALAAGTVAAHPHLQFTNGVSPGSSVIDLSTSGGAQGRAPGAPATPATMARQTSSASLLRSGSSSGNTARDMMSPGSTNFLAPQFRNASGTQIARNPSFAQPAWSIPQDTLSQDQKRLVKRWFVLRELLETEKAYASDLAVARDIYLARAKMRAGITAPLSPLSVRSASIFSQLASPDVSANARSSQPHQQQRCATTYSSGQTASASKGSISQRTLFRNASADATANALLASPNSSQQANSSVSLTSSNPSNRSSTYTVSSQSSQTSDASTFGSGLPPQFSIDGNPVSPTAGMKMVSGTPIAMSSPAFSPYPSTPGTLAISTPSGLSTGSFPGFAEGSASSTPDAPFSASDVRIIFAQLEACAAFADEMVATLESTMGKACSGTAEEALQMLARGEVNEESESDRVGQVFLKMMPRIEQVYSAYCSRHEASMSRLQELTKSQPKVAAFLSECTQAARAYTNAWDLSSLLIKPVQRVLKYPLLIAEIMASTTSMHPDAANLSAASVEIQKVADNINEVKKRKDLVEQIVSGKTTKRSTSQRMQHGAAKKLLRRQEKVKQLVLGSNEDLLADGGQYKALVAQFRQLEKAAAAFSKRCAGWSTSVKDAHVAQLRLLEQWCRAYSLDETSAGTEAETRLRAFMYLIQGTFLNEYWSQLDSEIRTSLDPAVERIAALFVLPQSVIAKRNDREPDYTRFRANPKSADKKLAESATAFIALHIQLMNELPQFNYGIQTLLDLCTESLARTQASYHLRVHRSLIDFWQTFGPEGNADIIHNKETDEKSMRHLNPVKLFWPLHSNMADFVESFGIVSGVEGRSRSASVSVDADLLSVGIDSTNNTHFSPLQSTNALTPDSEFAMRVSDTGGVQEQVENLAAAVDQELLEPLSARATPFTTPPMGSRQASFSSQNNQPLQLGSPAPIASAAPTLRSSKSNGLIGLFRSVGSSAGGDASSRTNSQSTDTAAESFMDFAASNPPTPISKDTPLMNGSSTTSEAVAPSLPALSFNSGLFSQSDFSAAQGSHGLGVETADFAHPGQRVETSNAPKKALPAPVGTMAAVANSPTEPGGVKNGYGFVSYAVGDLFRVIDHDEVHLFGSSEHGETGWVDRENFVPLT